jgi:hypothetical protein
MADDNGSSHMVEVRASEDGVDETDTSVASEIVLIPWDQAVKVGRQLVYLATRALATLT